MKLFKQLLVAPAALGLLAPMAATAADFNLDGVNKYASEEQVTSISQFSDVKPTDWSYQALSNLVERYGCVAGYPSGTFSGSKAMTRFEAAALLNACLDRVTEVTDELKKLMAEFEKELAVLKGRVDGLDAKVGALEAQQFSTTTKLSGQAIMAIGGTDAAGADEISFNYDLILNFDTSFTGNDLLKTTLRSGNFGDTYEAAGGLEYGFDSAGNVQIDRLFYQFPVGDFTFTAGPIVEQGDMLAMFPSLYPSDSMLDITRFAGAKAAYNMTSGAGAGVSYAKDGFNASLLFVTPNSDAASQTVNKGLFDDSAVYTAQVGYTTDNWGVAAIYTGKKATDYNAYGLSGYWAPAESGIFPSISAGFGFSEESNADFTSWTVGLVWGNVFVKGNDLGMAIGAAGAGANGLEPNGGNDDLVYEGYYKIQATDNISITPGFFWVENASSGKDVTGAVVKTTFTF